MPTILTATEAIRTFSDLLNQVRYQGKSFEIKRGKEVIATLAPVVVQKGLKISDLNEFFQELPSLDEDDLLDFEKTLKDIRSAANAGIDSWD